MARKLRLHKPPYNWDMMHCYQAQCAKRVTCYRSFLGQEAKNLYNRYASVYCPKETVINGCNFYLDIEDYYD